MRDIDANFCKAVLDHGRAIGFQENRANGRRFFIRIGWDQADDDTEQGFFGDDFLERRSILTRLGPDKVYIGVLEVGRVGLDALEELVVVRRFDGTIEEPIRAEWVVRRCHGLCEALCCHRRYK